MVIIYTLFTKLIIAVINRNEYLRNDYIFGYIHDDALIIFSFVLSRSSLKKPVYFFVPRLYYIHIIFELFYVVVNNPRRVL